MASGRFRSYRLAALALTGLLVAAASGCATAPSGGAPQRLKGQSGQQQAFVQPLPPPGPTPAWNPEDVVHGFLAASANFNLDPAAARLYLAPGVSWRPRSSGITVVSTTLTVTREIPPSRLPGSGEAKVSVSGQQLASLSRTGQYEPRPGAQTSYRFELAQNSNGVWLIESLPPGDPLLLTQAAFAQVFQPRNLYFFGPSQNILVPDPVFAPLQGPATANASILATGLVKGLLVDSGSWLSAATTTAFPTGTTCTACVTVSNLTALVNLQVPTPVSQSLVNEMYAQLSKTLTSNSYSPPVVTHVKLELNGRVRHASQVPAKVPAVGTAKESLYFAAAGLTNEIKPGKAARPVRVAAPAQLAARPPVTALAVSRDARPQLAIAVPNGKGCGLFVGSVGRTTGYTYYRLSGGGGACTSLSWDSGQNLWAVAGSRMWVLQPRKAPLQVTLPSITSPGLKGAQVVALRMAPDGVRAALLVRTPKGNNALLLAAVAYAPDDNSVTFGDAVPVGANLPNPKALSSVAWYSPDELVVVDGPGLWEVPLTAGAVQSLGQVPGKAVSITSTGYNLAIRTNTGLIYTSPVPVDGQWTPVSTARTGAAQAGPVYPG